MRRMGRAMALEVVEDAMSAEIGGGRRRWVLLGRGGEMGMDEGMGRRRGIEMSGRGAGMEGGMRGAGDRVRGSWSDGRRWMRCERNVRILCVEM